MEKVYEERYSNLKLLNIFKLCSILSNWLKLAHMKSSKNKVKI